MTIVPTAPHVLVLSTGSNESRIYNSKNYNLKVWGLGIAPLAQHGLSLRLLLRPKQRDGLALQLLAAAFVHRPRRALRLVEIDETKSLGLPLVVLRQQSPSPI